MFHASVFQYFVSLVKTSTLLETTLYILMANGIVFAELMELHIVNFEISNQYPVSENHCFLLNSNYVPFFLFIKKKSDFALYF